MNWKRGLNRSFVVLSALWIAVALTTLVAIERGQLLAGLQGVAFGTLAKRPLPQKLVEVPGLGTLKFPGELSNEEIAKFLDTALPKLPSKPDVFDIVSLESQAEELARPRRAQDPPRADIDVSYAEALGARLSRDKVGATIRGVFLPPAALYATFFLAVLLLRWIVEGFRTAKVSEGSSPPVATGDRLQDT